MPLEYRSITANCGNDTLGSNACEEISQLLIDDKADFFVINCQEAHFENTRKQLEDMLPEGYNVKCLSQIATHTKLDTQVFSTTGMATFVIYREGLEVNVEGKPVEARRENSRLSGSGYNKGGLVTDFTVQRSGDSESIKVQAVTGHLDAGDVVKRNQDWLNLYRATVKDVTSWEELVDACPDLLLSGYDANTRNKFNKQNNVETKIWDNPDEYPELHALHLVSMGAAKYSTDETYSHTKIDQETGEEVIADSKREGDAARGTLDFVTIYDGNINKNESRKELDKGAMVVQVGIDPGSKRDHHVIISPPQTSITLNEFDRVKNLMATRLFGVAPDVAAKILAITEGNNEDDKEKAKTQLVEYYKQYLGPNGFLDRAMDLHIRKLECFQRIMNNPQNKDLEEVLKKTLFGELEWCAGNPKQLEAKQELMEKFLDSLDECEHAEGINARLVCYLDLKEKIAKNEEINAADAFKNSAVEVYQNYYIIFTTALEQKTKENPQLQVAMEKILKRLDAIADHSNEEALKGLDPKKLDTLTHIVAQCDNSLTLLQAGAIEEMEKINEELMSLSHEAMGSSSPVWRALAGAVKFFVTLVANITSDVTLTDKVGMVQDKKLSKSIDEYKSALKEILPQEEESDHLHNNLL
ncbi:hypothetical protein LEAN103870_00025 [Legionella anisa]|uniref:Uncharacterized protein n=1 Tax=Legionella anisa TaxID=28082 RepID=A0AAX0WVI8_9GAMM|nr:hypothetical protein [Legionella anisa]AWN74023.1 hypothetical protein DLD14_09325 [Legionella anisa]KTC67296.1 hypothetical protein Lani_3641 [Legionella anisa]MBN5934034.1 hypothetical protein [Legionella anisa]MCW8425957.1 hypothetical protein [Legionella anisa]MCW8448609.1 hypothetical protein [Legionella anisa]